MGKIRVLLVDDHTVVRQGLRRILETDDEIEIVGETGDGRSASEMAQRMNPNVVVMDIAMPVLNGLEATRQITRAVPNTKVLVLRTAGGSGDVSLYVKAGAKPTATSFDSSSIHPGNAESVTVTRIGVATTYYLRVVGVKAYTGVMVQATFIP